MCRKKRLRQEKLMNTSSNDVGNNLRLKLKTKWSDVLPFIEAQDALWIIWNQAGEDDHQVFFMSHPLLCQHYNSSHSWNLTLTSKTDASISRRGLKDTSTSSQQHTLSIQNTTLDFKWMVHEAFLFRTHTQGKNLQITNLDQINSDSKKIQKIRLKKRFIWL